MNDFLVTIICTQYFPFVSLCLKIHGSLHGSTHFTHSQESSTIKITVMIPILLNGKLRLREARQFAQGHRAGRWQRQDLTTVCRLGALHYSSCLLICIRSPHRCYKHNDLIITWTGKSLQTLRVPKPQFYGKCPLFLNQLFILELSQIYGRIVSQYRVPTHCLSRVGFPNIITFPRYICQN